MFVLLTIQYHKDPIDPSTEYYQLCYTIQSTTSGLCTKEIYETGRIQRPETAGITH